jgi:glycosyltransferase involved in cell wall biosynthesis
MIIPSEDKIKNNLHINLICQFPFPHGYSGTNRILSYSSGLVILGHKVLVNPLSPTEDKTQGLNTEYRGNYNGIFFEYPFKRIIRSEYRFIRAPQVAIGYLITFYKILRNHINYSTDILLISNDNPFLLLPLVIFSRMIGIKKNVLIVDEYPIPIRFGSDKLPSLRSFLFRMSFKKLDGFIGMTNVLVDFYHLFFSSKTRAHLMPMTVETERFLPVNKSSSENIVYIGDLDIKKDGVDILIKSFAAIVSEYPELQLHLYGKGKIENETELKNLVTSLHVESKVIFFGKVSRNGVPDILKGAKILALSRPSSLRSNAGFPTKLGEYLASGTPVVVTKVGEIPSYLTHMKNAFLAEPDSVEDFSKILKQALDNYEEASIIGSKGRDLADSIFSSEVQSPKLSNFLCSLYKV